MSIEAAASPGRGGVDRMPDTRRIRYAPNGVNPAPGAAGISEGLHWRGSWINLGDYTRPQSLPIYQLAGIRRQSGLA